VKHKLVLLGMLVFAASAVSVTPANAAGDRHVLPGTKPGWTSSVPLAADVAGSQWVTAKVWLAPRNATQLDALASAVSDPASPSYAQYLTTAQYDATFAPTSAQVTAVAQWLTGSGLTVEGVDAGNAYVSVSGAAAAINSAFGTRLSLYIVNGKQERAPSVDVSVPNSVAGDVLAITGLSTLGHATAPADFGAPAGFRNATPCSSSYGQQTASTLPQFNGQTLAYAPCGYVPSQLRSVYGVTGGGHHDDGLGAGRTVAITDAFDSPRLLGDANTYATNRGDSPFAAGQFADLSVPETTDPTIGITDCRGNAWYTEQNLDVEAVHGMAPNANVLYYGAASCFDDDLLAQLAQVVQDNRASIVTNSWGEPTFVVINGTLYITIDQNEINAYESVFKHGAVLGIGFYFSSGDFGDELLDTGFAHPDWPTGDPWVTSVGGTSLGINSNGRRSFETGWGTAQWRLNSTGTAWHLVIPFQYGAGGGFSQIFPEPRYQKDIVGHDPTRGRAVPDIGLDADPNTGMLIGITQVFPEGTHYGEFRVGGTSLASPLFAGLQADAQRGRDRIGFANPLIYALDRPGPDGSVYFDVTPQGPQGDIRADFNNGLDSSAGIHFSVRTFDQDSSLATGRGWDDVTGVGAPTAAYIEAVSGVA